MMELGWDIGPLTGSKNGGACSSLLGFIPAPLPSKSFPPLSGSVTDLVKGVDLAPGVAGAVGVASKDLRGGCFPIIGDSDEDSISSGASLNRTMLFLATPEFWSETSVDFIIRPMAPGSPEVFAWLVRELSVGSQFCGVHASLRISFSYFSKKFYTLLENSTSSYSPQGSRASKFSRSS